jgi:hypothetical protein
VFLNPPYGREIGRWMRKAYESAQTTAELVVCVVPARTDTRWWHDWAARGEVTFLRGRLRFGDGSSPARSPVRSSSFVTEKALRNRLFRRPLDCWPDSIKDRPRGDRDPLLSEPLAKMRRPLGVAPYRRARGCLR